MKNVVKKRAREMLNQLNAILLEQNRLDDLKRTLFDTAYQEQLLIEYGIHENQECFNIEKQIPEN